MQRPFSLCQNRLSNLRVDCRHAIPNGRKKNLRRACRSRYKQLRSSNPLTGSGWPSFYLEDHVGPAQAMQGNVISMVAEGVFEAFPELKLVSVENGFGWIPSLLWRLDSAWTLRFGAITAIEIAKALSVFVY